MPRPFPAPRQTLGGRAPGLKSGGVEMRPIAQLPTPADADTAFEGTRNVVDTITTAKLTILRIAPADDPAFLVGESVGGGAIRLEAGGGVVTSLVMSVSLIASVVMSTAN